MVARSYESDVLIGQRIPTLNARTRSLYLEIGEDIRDVQALLDDHVIDGCSEYAEIPCHAICG